MILRLSLLVILMGCGKHPKIEKHSTEAPESDCGEHHWRVKLQGPTAGKGSESSIHNPKWRKLSLQSSNEIHTWSFTDGENPNSKPCQALSTYLGLFNGTWESERPIIENGKSLSKNETFYPRAAFELVIYDSLPHDKAELDLSKSLPLREIEFRTFRLTLEKRESGVYGKQFSKSFSTKAVSISCDDAFELGFSPYSTQLDPIVRINPIPQKSCPIEIRDFQFLDTHGEAYSVDLWGILETIKSGDSMKIFYDFSKVKIKSSPSGENT